MAVRAIVFGATGMVGEGVLHEALLSSEVEAVLSISRRPCEISHPKLKEIIHSDFFNFASIAEAVRGYNACFFCLGVTSVGKSEEEYRRLTYDLTMAAAKELSHRNPEMVFCYVSGAGTDSTEKGRLMWARVKGKTENDLRKLPFKSVYAFRPGYIRPTPGLKHAISLSKIVVPIYPLLERFLPKYVCTLEDVGRAMIRAVVPGFPKGVLECEDITRLAKE